MTTWERRTGWWLVAAQFFLLAVIVISPWGGRWTLAAWAGGVAQTMELGGLVVIVLGGLQLGRGASVHPEPTAVATLRTGGAYRYARHPIYTGVLLFAGAATIRSGSYVGAAAALALLLVLIVKTSLEERLLDVRFPGYASYARTTGRFGPRLWRAR